MSVPLKRLMELEAAHLVAEVLGGQANSRDVTGRGAIDGTHDFDVTLSDGKVVALEVTTAARQEMVGTFAALGGFVDAKFPSLTHNWSLTGRHPDDEHRGPQIRQLLRSGDALLRDLEAADVSKFDEVHRSAPPVTDPVAQEAVRRLHQLGVFAGQAMGVAPAGEAFVAVALVGGGGSVDPDALNQSVTRETQANLAKLERSGGDELHLFVWIDGSMFSEEMAMYLRNVPPSGPLLPPSITTVWAATWGPGVNFRSNTSRL